MTETAKTTAFIVGLKRLLLTTVILLNLLVYILAGFSLLESRITYEKQAAISTQNLSRVLDHYIKGEINSIDMALIAVKFETEGQIARGCIDKESLNRYMSRHHSYLSSLQGIRMTDSKGDVIYGTGLTPGINIADRDYFIFERDNPNGDLFISKPIFGRFAKEWIVTIARRVNNPDGSFAGMVYGAYTLNHLSKIFAGIDVGKKGTVNLRDNELALIVRYPEHQEGNRLIGQKKVPKEFENLIRAGSNDGTFKAQSIIDDEERLYSYRRISNYPLVIIVGLAKDDYLKAWQKEAVTQLCLVAFITFATLFFSRLLFVRWKREQEIEVELHDNRKQLSDIIEFLPDATLAIDKDKRIIIWNRAIEKMTGVMSQEMIGKSCNAYTIPFYGESRPGLMDMVIDNRAEISALFPHVVRTGDTLMGEVYCNALYNNAGAWALTKASPLYDQSGNIIGAIETIRDITESKQSHEQVKNLSQRLQLAVSSVNLGVWDWSIHDNQMVWNDRMFELYGTTCETFAGNVDAWVSRLHPEDRDRVIAASQAALNEDKKFDITFRVCHPDGTVKHIKADAMVLRGEDGTAERMIGINADITEIKNAEEEKVKLEAQLMQQNRQAAMGEMIGNIAHQWRQPLNALGLTIQQLSLYQDLGELTKEFLGNSVSKSMELIQHMSQTIDDFRNYFKPDKKKTQFRIQEAINSTLSLVEDSFKSQRIEVLLDSKADLVIHGFRNEFAQVVLNILNNARDVLVERKIKNPMVTITLDSENDKAVVIISDNAGGIPEEIMGKIFDPYFTTKGPQAGTGVGLFMSKTIIEKNMGGRLSVRNRDNGAEFRIEV